MKRNRITITVLAFLSLITLLMNACVKTGTAPPQITLIGDTTITISLDSAWTDPGANVTDELDGTDALSSDFSLTNPNVHLTGTYIIHYYAADNNGNSAHATRKVKVVNDAQNLAGKYRVSEAITGKNAGSYVDTVIVTSSSTVNNQLLINNFGGLGNDVTVFIKLTGNNVNLSPASQSPSGLNDPGSITGNGTKSGNQIVSFNYHVTYSVGTDQSNTSWAKLTPPF